ncbi:ornithine aminotransferase [bacterium 336/3]|nr:ornithine aminotransferase [bacterium 336/3]
MKNNEELQRRVTNAIKWEPLLSSSEIEVTVEDSIVSLLGVVDSYAKKIEAENAAKRVNGVRAVVQKIQVKLPDSWIKTNLEIAGQALNALKTNWSVPDEKIVIKVEDGWITLEGELPWNYQKEAAKNALNYLKGIRGVFNNIQIKPEIHDNIEQKDVENALNLSWSIDDTSIYVKVSGTTVVLTGTVNSWYQKEEAERIAWNTPDIRHINNDLSIDSICLIADE